MLQRMGGSGIVVYSIVGCPHCKAAKKRLHYENLQFLDVSVDKYWLIIIKSIFGWSYKAMLLAGSHQK